MDSRYPIEDMPSEVSPLTTDDEQLESEDIYKTPMAEFYAGRKTQSLFAVTGTTPRTKIPIGASTRQLKELRSDLEQCRAQLLFAQHRERELRRMIPTKVDEIMDKFFELQLEAINLREEVVSVTSERDKFQRQFAELQQKKQKDDAQMKAERDECLRILAELQLQKQKDDKQMKSVIDDLNKKLCESAEYLDFSLTSTVADPDVIELQQKLNDALEENTRLLDLIDKKRLTGQSSIRGPLSMSTTNQATNHFGLLSPEKSFYAPAAWNPNSNNCVFSQSLPSTSSGALDRRLTTPFVDTSVQHSPGIFGCASKPSRDHGTCILL